MQTHSLQEKHSIDFTKIFAAYVSYMKLSKVKIDVPTDTDGNTQSMEVHTTFLCVAGSLLQVSKYVHLFQETILPNKDQKIFANVVSQEFEHVQAKQKSECKYKVDAFAPVLSPYFKMISKAVVDCGEVLNKLRVSAEKSNEEAYYGHLLSCLAESFAIALECVSSEVGCWFENRYVWMI